MTLNPQLRDILTLIGDLTQNNVNARNTITIGSHLCIRNGPVVVPITDLSVSNRLTLLF